MGFQQRVNRNFTQGFPGEIVRAGPSRGQSVRIAKLTPAVAARYQGNLVARVYGFTGEVPASGQTLAAIAPIVTIGGPVYAGVLIHPKHYALFGNATEGALGASLKLADGAEAEVSTMNIIVAEIFNLKIGAVNVTPEFAVGYVPNNVDVAKETVGIPYGALVVAETAEEITDAGCLLLPGVKIENNIGLAASAVGAPVSGLTIVQLTY